MRSGCELVSPPRCHSGQGAGGLPAPTTRRRAGVRATERGPGVRAGRSRIHPQLRPPSTFHWPFSRGFLGTWGSACRSARLLSAPWGTDRMGELGPGRTWPAQGSLCRDRSRRQVHGPPPAPRPPTPRPGCELLEMPQNPLFAVCLFSILNIENGQPVELNNSGLFLMLSLAGGGKMGCQRGGSSPEAAQAHSESPGDRPIDHQLRGGGRLRGSPLGPFSHFLQGSPTS